MSPPISDDARSNSNSTPDELLPDPVCVGVLAQLDPLGPLMKTDDEPMALAQLHAERVAQAENYPIAFELARTLPIPFAEARHRLSLGHSPERIKAEVQLAAALDQPVRRIV